MNEADFTEYVDGRITDIMLNGIETGMASKIKPDACVRIMIEGFSKAIADIYKGMIDKEMITYENASELMIQELAIRLDSLNNA